MLLFERGAIGRRPIQGAAFGAAANPIFRALAGGE